MRMTITLLPFLLLLAACGAGERRAPHNTDRSPAPLYTPTVTPDDTLTVGFYNLENLFDTEDDPATDDAEFTPDGKNHWTPQRLEKKLSNMARAIRAMNNYHGPDLLGVCEVENRGVLERLVNEFLPKGEYDIAHRDSPDGRGIDVAVLFRRSLFTLRSITMHRVDLGEGARPTRDIMEATFEHDGHTVTMMVNHWPSRLGGETESAPRRASAARTAAATIDSLVKLDPKADIIMVGDLNDYPGDPSVHDVLDARGWVEGEKFTHRMINTAAPLAEADTIGTHYYGGHWGVLDQVMLAPGGATDDAGLVMLETCEQPFHPDFMRDRKADPIVLPPYRTFKGPIFIGGYSDHFPALLRVGWKSGGPAQSNR